MSCHKLRLISYMMMASYEERNALKPIMHEHDNLEGTRGRIRDRIPADAIKQKTVVIVREVAAKLEPAKDYKRLALSPRQWEEPSSSSNPQSDITSEEHLKILLRFLHKNFTISSLLPTSEFILYVYIETIEETHGTRSSRPTVRRVVSLLRGNQEYFWSILDLTLGRDSWHHIRRLSIRKRGAFTFRGTYRYEPYTRSGGKRGLFLEGALV